MNTGKENEWTRMRMTVALEEMTRRTVRVTKITRSTMGLIGVVPWRQYEYHDSILLVRAATQARRTPETAVVVSAVVGIRSVSRKLVGTDGGARFGAVRSKHGEMNSKGPRGSRHTCFGTMCELSIRDSLGGLGLYIERTKCTHPVGA